MPGIDQAGAQQSTGDRPLKLFRFALSLRKTLYASFVCARQRLIVPGTLVSIFHDGCLILVM